MDGFDTRASHGSDRVRAPREQPLSVPIYQVSDYAYESAGHYADVINERQPGYVYGRYGGPTVEVLGELLASLEGAEAGWAFTSGIAAIHAVLMHLAGTGDHIVAAKTLYGGTFGLFTVGASRVGLDVSFADATDAAQIEQAMLPSTKAVFIESVPNPTFEVSDIEGIGRICRDAGVPLVVDNTVPTPALLNPIALGAELVVHATSKYIGGHHDLMGGVVVGPKDRIDDIRHLAIRYGTTASALESWLALRGTATLGLRMERHSSNAAAVAEHLRSLPRIKSVTYPGLSSHPQYERAKRWMRSPGGMMALDLGSQEAAWAFMDKVKIARVGSSFGGVRTELTHPATTSHRQFSAEEREAAGIGDGSVRVSIGIESVDDLIADLEQALA